MANCFNSFNWRPVRFRWSAVPFRPRPCRGLDTGFFNKSVHCTRRNRSKLVVCPARFCVFRISIGHSEHFVHRTVNSFAVLWQSHSTVWFIRRTSGRHLIRDFFRSQLRQSVPPPVLRGNQTMFHLATIFLPTPAVAPVRRVKMSMSRRFDFSSEAIALCISSTFPPTPEMSGR